MSGLPDYTLYADVRSIHHGAHLSNHWYFALSSIDGKRTIEAADKEPDATGEQLELWSVIRGLEAIGRPSGVLLMTPNRYVVRGIRFGIDAWRDSRWRWERFGLMVPIKNDFLWRRLDRALKHHQVRLRLGRGKFGLQVHPESPSTADQVASWAENARPAIMNQQLVSA